MRVLKELTLKIGQTCNDVYQSPKTHIRYNFNMHSTARIKFKGQTATIVSHICIKLHADKIRERFENLPEYD